MRILELFAGYGSQALALENLGIDFTSDISEIDKYAIRAYNQLHGETHNWGDITKIDETKLPYYDLITYSSPCQDFSVAGLQKGGDLGSGTRSSLLWECERIIRAVKPKYLLMENVKNLVGKKHKHNFIRWLRVLEMMGYQNFWKVLNAKDYGVPQNRERVFVVSILGCGQYLFPNPIKLEKRLKDILEPKVKEKYYLNNRTLEYFVRHNEEHKDKTNFIWQPTDIEKYAKSLRANSELAVTDNTIAEPLALDEQNNCIRLDGTCGTLTTDGSTPKHNNRVIEPNVLTPKRTDYGKQIRKEYESGTVKESRHNMTELEPRQDGISNTLTSVQKDNILVEPVLIGGTQKHQAQKKDGISTCLCSSMECGGGYVPMIMKNYRIRRLTPKECWRLMGVKDEQFSKLRELSDSRLYKLAGNSIVVDVLMGIFKNLFFETNTTGQLTLL